MQKYLPFIVVAIVMVYPTYLQWKLMDWVWGDNIPAVQCAYLLHKEIPKEIGDWVGVDSEVSDLIRETAGAEGYISRTYTNSKTGDQVGVWLIVGHFRNVMRHTPNICYIASGYKEAEGYSKYRFNSKESPDSEFHTTKYTKEEEGIRYYTRVYWAWWKPTPLEEGQSVDDVQVTWVASNSPQDEIGHCRALYKLYFSALSDDSETSDESVCNRFAAEFLPVVSELLPQSNLLIEKKELPEDYLTYLPQLRSDEEKKKDKEKKKAEEKKKKEAEEAKESTEAEAA